MVRRDRRELWGRQELWVRRGRLVCKEILGLALRDTRGRLDLPEWVLLE